MGVGNLSQYATSGILTHLFRTATFAKPTNLYIALASGTLTGAMRGDLSGNEIPNQGAYARQALNPADANWAGITYVNGSGMTANTPAITFPAATSPGWGGQQITDVAIVDNGTYGLGNVLWFGKLQVPKLIGIGDTFSFSAGNIQALLD
jgi:hypothetical protein